MKWSDVKAKRSENIRQKWEERMNGGVDYIPGFDDGEEKEVRGIH